MGVIDGKEKDKKRSFIFPVAEGDREKIIKMVSKGKVILYIDDVDSELDINIVRRVVSEAFPNDSSKNDFDIFQQTLQNSGDHFKRIIFVRSNSSEENWEYEYFQNDNYKKDAIDLSLDESGFFKRSVSKNYLLCDIRNLKPKELNSKEIESFLSKYSEVKQSL